MTRRPRVSVLVAAYQHAEFIAAAMLSAIEQDYPDLEVVVGDDGSTDETPRIIDQLAAQYPSRVRVIDDRTHLGITGNANRILAACTGDLIAFLGGDDLYLPGKISRQVAWFEEDPRRALCGHDSEWFEHGSGRTLLHYRDLVPLSAGVGPTYLPTVCPFDALSIMVRASTIPAGGFDARFPYVAEAMLWIHCVDGGGHYGFVPGVLCRHRFHERNVTRLRKFDNEEELIRMLRCAADEHPHLRRALRRAAQTETLNLGRALFAAGDAPRARRHLAAFLGGKVRNATTMAMALALTAAPPPLFKRLSERLSRSGRWVDHFDW